MTRAQFEQLVARLVDRTPQLQRLRDPLTGMESSVVIRHEPGLIEQLSEAVDQKRGAVSGSSRHEHSEPANVNAIDLWVHIEREASEVYWEFRDPQAKRQQAGLAELIRAWAKQVAADPGLRGDAYQLVVKWVVLIRALLEPALERNLRGLQCGVCGVSSVVELVEVEAGRAERRWVPAMVAVVAEGTVVARCRGCGAEWVGEQACAELNAAADFGLRVHEIAATLSSGW